MNKKTMYTGSFVLLLAFAVFSSIKLSNVSAKSDQAIPKHKAYVSYEIKPGDTLTSIARENVKGWNISVDDYVYEVMENNHLSDDKITSGKNLILAKYSD